MKAVVDRIVQYANRYQLTNVETGEVLGTFDFEEVTGTVQQVGTEIDKELFDSIANDLAARVKLSGGELAKTIVTFPDISGTAENVASGDTSATLWGKVKNWFSRLKALAFKNKVAAGDFEAGAIKNADVAADAAIAQSKVSGLMTDYVASIDVSGRTVTYKNKNGVNIGSITTQDTTYELASPSGNGLMSSTDKTKLDGIESGAQKNTVLGVKGGSESAYRTGNVNITKANIGLGNVDNTSDEDKPVSAATQTALNGKANTSGTYPNLTVGKATNADNAKNATKATQDANGNVIDETYATKDELTEKTGTKVKVNGATQPEVNFTSDPQTQITANKNAIAEAQSDISDIISGAQTVGKATRDANGNVIDTTYSKLSQVVRIDAAQQFTDDQKWRFSKNSRFILKKKIERAPKWKTVACISNYGQVCMAVSTDLPGSGHLIAKFFLAIGYGSAANITQIGYTANSPISAIRLRSATNAKTYVDLLFNEITAIETTVSVYFEANLTNAYESTDIQLFDFVDFSGDESDYTITTLNLCNSGINTTGTIYQQGEPVFATDPSKLVPSTANGWTQSGTTGDLPGAGVYLVTTYAAHDIGIMIYDGTNQQASCMVGDSKKKELQLLRYDPYDTQKKWRLYRSEGEQSIAGVYYKRIA